MPGCKIISGVISEKRYDTRNMCPIYMNIEERHKDRDLKSSVVEVLVFFNFFDNYNFTIGWSGNFMGVSDRMSYGVSEKCNEKYCKNDRNCTYDASPYIDTVKIKK
jgi:hypothetical protein